MTLSTCFLLFAACGATTPPIVGAPASINESYLDPDLDPKVWVERFETERREVYREREPLIAALGIRAGDTVVDVGTGTGIFVDGFARAVGPTGQVVALDIVPKFVELVRARAAKQGLTQVAARKSEPSDVGLEEASADLVFICDTYHHFEDPAAILATIRRGLRPGGRLAVVDYHRIEGKTRPFLMEHVRAGQEVFVAEIEASGFVRLPDPPAPFLDENYLVVFARP